MTLWFPELGLGFQPINKNASSSLTDALARAGHRQEAYQSGPVVVMWREPHQRAESAYRFLRPSLSFSDWVILLCRIRLTSPMVLPQAEQCARIDHVIRWNFDEFARLFGVAKIDWRNRSLAAETDWNDEARDAFDGRYAEDIDCWEGLTPHPTQRIGLTSSLPRSRVAHVR